MTTTTVQECHVHACQTETHEPGMLGVHVGLERTNFGTDSKPWEIQAIYEDFGNGFWSVYCWVAEGERSAQSALEVAEAIRDVSDWCARRNAEIVEI